MAGHCVDHPRCGGGAGSRCGRQRLGDGDRVHFAHRRDRAHRSGLKAEASKEKTIGLTLGIITALAGIAIIGHPLFGLAFLTLLLVGYFVVEGVWKIVVSFQYMPATGSKWLLASGVLSLVLGLLIWNQWPVSGMWAVGVLVGVNLLGTGLALVTLASTLNRSPDRGA